MSTKHFACYEYKLGEWCLVVYHDEKPTLKGPNALIVTRSPFYEVPDHMIDFDGTPNFLQIKTHFPPPKKPEL